MLHTFDCLRTRSSIREIKKLDGDILAVSTELHGVRLVNTGDYQTKATISHEHLNSHTKAIAVSKNAEFMAFTNKTHIFILHIPSEIVLKTIKTDGESIEYLEFDLESKYIIASTASGRILQYRYDGSSLIARLYSYERSSPNLQPKATSFAFKAHDMVCGSSNGILFSMNLHSRSNKSLIHNDTAQINSICYINDNAIASGDAKGNIYFNSIKNNTLIKKIETGFTNVKQLILLPNPNYMLVSSKEKNIAVYDLSTYVLVHNKYIEFNSNVRKVSLIDQDNLIVGLENNMIERVALPRADKLKAYIVESALDKAYALVKQDPLLKGTKEYKLLEIAFAKVYKAALNALMKQNNDKAQEYTKIFKYVDVKQTEIQELFKAFENYPRFKILYAEKKYALAYAMCEKHPPLSQTFQYKKLEELWDKAFDNAQRQIAHGRIENAVTLLSEYVTVTKKRPIIKLILKHNTNFVTFLKALEVNDFQTITSLAKDNPLFTLVPTYKNVQTAIESSIKSIQKDIQKCDLTSAIKKLSKLQNIPSIEKTISLQKNECRAIKKLQSAYKVNDFISCYEIIDSNHFLNTTELGILLQTHWAKLISKCEAQALKGNVKSIKETLDELIHLKTRKDKIGDLFRLAFHTKIKALVFQKAYKKSESIVYSYIDIFGIDKEITSIIRTIEKRSKTKLALTQGAHISRDQWVNSKFITGE